MRLFWWTNLVLLQFSEWQISTTVLKETTLKETTQKVNKLTKISVLIKKDSLRDRIFLKHLF